MKKRDTLGLILVIITALMMIAALWMAFVYAPREAVMRDMQRIFYFHVSSAWVGFFAFFVTFVAGIAYLVKNERRWDILALSSVEIGLTFIAMTVVTGSLWAKPTWNTYWTWSEPRLTISAIQLMVYVSYIMLRAAIESPERKARFAAVYGIVAFVTVPLSWFAIRWWTNTLHPDVTTSDEGGLQSQMIHAMLFSIASFSMLYATLLRQRIRLERAADALTRLRIRLEHK
jgi:heme exporter protein C